MIAGTIHIELEIMNWLHKFGCVLLLDVSFFSLIRLEDMTSGGYPMNITSKYKNLQFFNFHLLSLMSNSE